MGGVGFTKDYPIEKYYRDCKIGEHDICGAPQVTEATMGKGTQLVRAAGRSDVAVSDWTREGRREGLIAAAVIGLCRNSPLVPL